MVKHPVEVSDDLSLLFVLQYPQPREGHLIIADQKRKGDIREIVSDGISQV